MAGLDNRIPPPIILLATGGAMAAAAALGPSIPLAPAWRWGLAGLLFVVAGSYGIPAIRAFARAGTTINPVAIDTASALVTSGPFGRSRNPMYVAMALLLTAWALALDSLGALAGPLLFVVFITRFQIVPEERAMAARFGAAYHDYRQRVRRWL
jgi:protein-S-isoprenylcysteine O-methyltransferase Ste14